MTILVLTDFSPNARKAVEYAAGFARKLQAHLIFLHVIPRRLFEENDASAETSRLMRVHAVEKTLKKIISEVNYGDISVSYDYLYGSCTEALQTFTAGRSVDLIIIGAKGANNNKNKLMGDTAYSIIHQSNIPVLVVPERAFFTNISNIFYVSDLKNVNQEAAHLVPFARLFHASINIVHVVPEFVKESNPEGIADFLNREFNYNKFNLAIIKNEDSVLALQQYLYENRAEVLAMFLHGSNILDSLYEKSRNSEVVFSNKLPMLIFKDKLPD